MAFPIVQSVTETQFSSSTTAHAVSMPATVNAGDLLIVLFVQFAQAATVTTPSGWTQLHSTQTGGLGRLSAYYKSASGSEDGGTVDFVTSSSTTAAAQTYRITGWSAVEVATAALGNPGDNSPNPPSLNPSGWDTEDTLWIAYFGAADDDETVSTYPTNYTNGVDTISGAGANLGCEMGSARRELAASSENPGTFLITGGEDWVAGTIAVRPAPAQQTLVAPLLNAAPTLNAHTLAATYSLAAPLLNAAPTFYAHEFAGDAGEQTLEAPLLDNGATFYDPAFAPGSVSLTAPLLANGATFYNPALAASYTLTAPLLDSAAVLYAPEIDATYLLSAPLLTNSPVFYDAVFAPTYTLTAPLLNAGATMYAHSFPGQDITIVAPLLNVPPAFFAHLMREKWTNADTGVSGIWTDTDFPYREI